MSNAERLGPRTTQKMIKQCNRNQTVSEEKRKQETPQPERAQHKTEIKIAGHETLRPTAKSSPIE